MNDDQITQITKHCVEAQLFRLLLALYLTSNERYLSAVSPFLKAEVARWLNRAGGMAGEW